MTSEERWLRTDVSAWVGLSVEQSGSTRNTWLEEPNSGARWLHKDTVIPENRNEQGEDWSEIFSTQVALALGVPCAATRMCARDGRRGTISRNVRPPGHDLNEGMVALNVCPQVLGYFPHTEEEPGVDPERPDVARPGHSLMNIQAALNGVLAPPDFEGPEALGAFDVFVGFLTLDALIANRDRHEQNWAVLTPQLASIPERLSPTYDHASSLGYNLLDNYRERLLAPPNGVQKWAANGTAYRFEHEGSPTTLVALAVEALGMCSDERAHYWRGQIADLDLDPIFAALDANVIPEMSAPAAKFASALLRHNHERLRNAI